MREVATIFILVVIFFFFLFGCAATPATTPAGQDVGNSIEFRCDGTVGLYSSQGYSGKTMSAVKDHPKCAGQK